MDILYISLALLGIGLIIFIHEAGHFLAAKKVGVRVERFALGFDPTIKGRRLRFFSFQRGDTEYVLGMIPFGGYVKMAGEMIPENPDDKPAEDELLAKSVGARALVFVAGAVMNILSACIFFMIAFSMGVPFVDAKIGSVTPGGEAWKQGLRSGDDIVAINGDEINEFYEVILGVALSKEGETLEFEVERPVDPTNPDSETNRVKVSVKPRWNADRGINEIGVGPATTTQVSVAPKEGTYAARAGLGKGDRIVGLEVRGRKLPKLAPNRLIEALRSYQSMENVTDVKLNVVKTGSDAPTELSLPEPEEDEYKTNGELRMARFLGDGGGTIVRELAPDSAAAEHLAVGDRVLSVGGKAVGSLSWMGFLDLNGETTQVRKRSATGEESTFELSIDALLSWSLNSEVLWGADGAIVSSVEAGSSAAKARILAGDRITKVDGKTVFEGAKIDELLASGEHKVEVFTELVPRELTISTGESDSAGTTGIAWNNFNPIGVVTTDGPAFNAGIVPGSRIIELAGTRVTGLRHFVELLSKTEIDKDVNVKFIDPSGAVQDKKLKPLAHTSLATAFGLKPAEVEVVSDGIMHSFELGAKRVVHVGRQVFMTLRSLIRRDVSAKNLSGPVGITHVFTQAAQQGLGRLIYFMAMVSVNLGLLNLMPFPILDGGHLLFLLIEKIKGSPVSIKFQEMTTTVAFFLIIGLFLFVTFHDIKRAIFF